MDLHFEEHNNQSLKRFEKMLKTDSVYFFDSAEFERIIQYYIDSGKVTLAKKAIALGLEQHPDSIGLRLLSAELYIIEDRFDTAETILDEIESLEPTNEEVYIQKAALLSKKDQHEEAVQLLNIALEISKDDSNIDILSMIGMEYLYLEDFERALLYFRNCLEINAEDYTTLYNVVYCYDMLDKPIEAISFLESHIEYDPYSETAWHQLGRQFYNTDKYKEALKAFDFAILIDESFVGAYIEKARVLEKLGRHREAIENYLITTEIEDPTPFAFSQAAKLFEQLNSPSKAHEFYLKAYELDPSLDKTIIALADLSYKLHDYQKSIYYINKLINIDNRNTSYWRVYADSNFKISFYEEAIKAYKRCFELGDKSLEVYTAIADSYFYLGDYKNAVYTLISAESLYHPRTEIGYRLSGLYFLIDDTRSAVKYLTSSLKTNSQHYRLFQKLFPIYHNTELVQNILRKHNLSQGF